MPFNNDNRCAIEMRSTEIDGNAEKQKLQSSNNNKGKSSKSKPHRDWKAPCREQKSKKNVQEYAKDGVAFIQSDTKLIEMI